uniref:Uncharacterized protein n=1 Tax=Megaselia scalaris TaxID=36166 RepID=T1GA91_MEGSC
MIFSNNIILYCDVLKPSKLGLTYAEILSGHTSPINLNLTNKQLANETERQFEPPIKEHENLVTVHQQLVETITHQHQPQPHEVEHKNEHLLERPTKHRHQHNPPQRPPRKKIETVESQPQRPPRRHRSPRQPRQELPVHTDDLKVPETSRSRSRSPMWKPGSTSFANMLKDDLVYQQTQIDSFEPQQYAFESQPQPEVQQPQVPQQQHQQQQIQNVEWSYFQPNFYEQQQQIPQPVVYDYTQYPANLQLNQLNTYQQTANLIFREQNQYYTPIVQQQQYFQEEEPKVEPQPHFVEPQQQQFIDQTPYMHLDVQEPTVPEQSQYMETAQFINLDTQEPIPDITFGQFGTPTTVPGTFTTVQRTYTTVPGTHTTVQRTETITYTQEPEAQKQVHFNEPEKKKEVPKQEITKEIRREEIPKTEEGNGKSYAEVLFGLGQTHGHPAFQPSSHVQVNVVQTKQTTEVPKRQKLDKSPSRDPEVSRREDIKKVERQRPKPVRHEVNVEEVKKVSPDAQRKYDNNSKPNKQKDDNKHKKLVPKNQHLSTKIHEFIEIEQNIEQAPKVPQRSKPNEEVKALITEEGKPQKKPRSPKTHKKVIEEQIEVSEKITKSKPEQASRPEEKQKSPKPVKKPEVTDTNKPEKSPKTVKKIEVEVTETQKPEPKQKSPKTTKKPKQKSPKPVKKVEQKEVEKIEVSETQKSEPKQKSPKPVKKTEAPKAEPKEVESEKSPKPVKKTEAPKVKPTKNVEIVQESTESFTDSAKPEPKPRASKQSKSSQIEEQTETKVSKTSKSTQNVETTVTVTKHTTEHSQKGLDTITVTKQTTEVVPIVEPVEVPVEAPVRKSKSKKNKKHPEDEIDKALRELNESQPKSTKDITIDFIQSEKLEKPPSKPKKTKSKKKDMVERLPSVDDTHSIESKTQTEDIASTPVSVVSEKEVVVGGQITTTQVIQSNRTFTRQVIEDGKVVEEIIDELPGDEQVYTYVENIPPEVVETRMINNEVVSQETEENIENPEISTFVEEISSKSKNRMKLVNYYFTDGGHVENCDIVDNVVVPKPDEKVAEKEEIKEEQIITEEPKESKPKTKVTLVSSFYTDGGKVENCDNVTSVVVTIPEKPDQGVQINQESERVIDIDTTDLTTEQTSKPESISTTTTTTTTEQTTSESNATMTRTSTTQKVTTTHKTFVQKTSFDNDDQPEYLIVNEDEIDKVYAPGRTQKISLITHEEKHKVPLEIVVEEKVVTKKESSPIHDVEECVEEVTSTEVSPQVVEQNVTVVEEVSSDPRSEPTLEELSPEDQALYLQIQDRTSKKDKKQRPAIPEAFLDASTIIQENKEIIQETRDIIDSTKTQIQESREINEITKTLLKSGKDISNDFIEIERMSSEKQNIPLAPSVPPQLVEEVQESTTTHTVTTKQILLEESKTQLAQNNITIEESKVLANEDPVPNQVCSLDNARVSNVCTQDLPETLTAHHYNVENIPSTTDLSPAELEPEPIQQTVSIESDDFDIPVFDTIPLSHFETFEFKYKDLQEVDTEEVQEVVENPHYFNFEVPTYDMSVLERCEYNYAIQKTNEEIEPEKIVEEVVKVELKPQVPNYFNFEVPIYDIISLEKYEYIYGVQKAQEVTEIESEVIPETEMEKLDEEIPVQEEKIVSIEHEVVVSEDKEIPEIISEESKPEEIKEVSEKVEIVESTDKNSEEISTESIAITKEIKTIESSELIVEEVPEVEEEITHHEPIPEQPKEEKVPEEIVEVSEIKTTLVEQQVPEVKEEIKDQKEIPEEPKEAITEKVTEEIVEDKFESLPLVDDTHSIESKTQTENIAPTPVSMISEREVIVGGQITTTQVIQSNRTLTRQVIEDGKVIEEIIDELPGDEQKL